MKPKIDLIHLSTEIISWTLLVVFAVLMILSILSNVDIAGSYRTFLVQSGSMEPGIMTGDIIITRSQRQYQLKDTITFLDRSNRKVTHRIIESVAGSKPVSYITKGDANRTEDRVRVSTDKIVGKVIFTIPRLGYMVVFSKSFPGLILFIVIPAFLIIFDEIRKIKINQKIKNK